MTCWLIIIKDDRKILFSIVTTPSYSGGHYSFPWIAPLTFDQYHIMLRVKQGGVKYHFLSFWYDSI